MANYARLAATALRLINANGRSVTLTKRSQTPLDAAQPWRGNNPTGDVPVTLKGVFSSDTADAETAEIIRRGNKVFLIAASATAADLRLYSKMTDSDGTIFEVVKARLVKPGDTALLWKLEVKG